MPTENKPVALNSTLQSLVTKMQLVSDALDDTVQSDWAETDATDDSYIRNKPEMDFWTDNTIAGNPLSFDTGSAQTAISTKISMEPIQDLHGYDYPWPEGGGKNKIPIDVTEGEVSGITATKIYDNAGNAIGVRLTGNSGSSVLYRSWTFNLPAGSYIYDSGYADDEPSSSAISDSMIQLNDVTIARGNNTTPGHNFTIAEDSTLKCLLRIRADRSNVDVLYQPMIRLATETDATFAPYSNICPISGRTQVILNGCGKNLGKFANEKGIDINGDIVTNRNRVSTVDPIYINPLLQYKVSCNDSVPNVEFVCAVFNGDELIRRTINISSGSILDVSGGTKFYVCAYKLNNTLTIEDIQPIVELATDSANYEPYQSSNEITISFGETVYGGTLDVEKGELTVDKIYRSGNYFAKSSITSLSFNTPGYTKFWLYDSRKILTDEDDAYCNVARFMYDDSPNKQYSLFWTNHATYPSSFYIKLPSDIVGTTQDSIYNWLQTGALEICYKTTPTTISLTPQQVQLLKGHNTIWTDGDNIELTYINDSKNLTEVNDDFTIITDSIAPTETNLQSSSHNYVIGNYMLINGKLYKVTFPILIGGEIIIGTNVTATTIGAELMAALQ